VNGGAYLNGCRLSSTLYFLRLRFATAERPVLLASAPVSKLKNLPANPAFTEETSEAIEKKGDWPAGV